MVYDPTIESYEHQIAPGSDFNGAASDGASFKRGSRWMYTGGTTGGLIDIPDRLWTMEVSQIEVNLGTVAVPMVLSITDGITSTTIVSGSYKAWSSTDSWNVVLGKYMMLVTTGGAQAMELAFLARRSPIDATLG